MRLFLAVDVPQFFHPFFVKLQKSISGARSKPVSHFHITVKFLGEVDEKGLSSLKESLSKVDFQKFSTRFEKVGVFPDLSKPRVVWVGLSEEGVWSSLREEVDSAIPSLGDDRSFKPHATLARVKEVLDFDELKESLRSLGESVGVADLGFSVDCLKLYKSILTPGGPEYEVIAEFRLQKGL